jgi:hypothetical protein
MQLTALTELAWRAGEAAADCGVQQIHQRTTSDPHRRATGPRASRDEPVGAAGGQAGSSEGAPVGRAVLDRLCQTVRITGAWLCVGETRGRENIASVQVSSVRHLHWHPPGLQAPLGHQAFHHRRRRVHRPRRAPSAAPRGLAAGRRVVIVYWAGQKREPFGWGVALLHEGDGARTPTLS